MDSSPSGYHSKANGFHGWPKFSIIPNSLFHAWNDIPLHIPSFKTITTPKLYLGSPIQPKPQKSRIQHMIHGNLSSQRKLFHYCFFSQLSTISPRFSRHELSRNKPGKSNFPQNSHWFKLLRCQTVPKGTKSFPETENHTEPLLFPKKFLDSFTELG